MMDLAFFFRLGFLLTSRQMPLCFVL